MPSLLLVIQAIDPFLRAHIASVRIDTGPDGYRVVMSINHYGPVSLELKEHVEHRFPVAMQGVSRHPDLEASIDWQTPIWDQITDLIHNPELSSLEELGSMEAVELSRDEPDGTASQREALKTWIVKTHVKRNDRNSWLARCMKYSASIESPAE